MGEPEVEKEACPTRGGVYSAYLPEFKIDGEWRTVPMVKHLGEPMAVPFPMHQGGITMELDLCGYAQAQALAWQYAACDAQHGNTTEVRVKEFRVHYDMKAYAVVESQQEGK